MWWLCRNLILQPRRGIGFHDHNCDADEARASKKKAAIEAIQAGLKERSLRVAGYEPFLANLAFLCVHERGATQVLRASDRDQRPDWCHSAPSARVRDGPELSQQAGLARRTHP